MCVGQIEEPLSTTVTPDALFQFKSISCFKQLSERQPKQRLARNALSSPVYGLLGGR